MVRTRNHRAAVLRMRSLLAALLISSACAAVPRQIEENQAADDPAANLYRAKCASCHRLRAPSERSREQWQAAIEKYGKKALLTVAQADQLLGWLQRNASDAPPPAAQAGTR